MIFPLSEHDFSLRKKNKKEAIIHSLRGLDKKVDNLGEMERNRRMSSLQSSPEIQSIENMRNKGETDRKKIQTKKCASNNSKKHARKFKTIENEESDLNVSANHISFRFENTKRSIDLLEEQICLNLSRIRNPAYCLKSE